MSVPPIPVASLSEYGLEIAFAVVAPILATLAKFFVRALQRRETDISLKNSVVRIQIGSKPIDDDVNKRILDLIERKKREDGGRLRDHGPAVSP